MSSSSYRINRVSEALEMRTYLEVGVQHGNTFREVTLARKTAVDPGFLFDTADFAGQTHEFFETTSDHYFMQRDPAATFDFVFLDGLHTFEQTLRDFNNALTATHAESVILIDDVWPSDIFSAIPDFVECVNYREMHTHERIGTWQGDVFKLIFYIHDFFPSLSYVTVDQSFGNPQTYVVRRPRPDFEPLLGNLERITRLSFMDFHEMHESVLNIMSEPEAIDWVVGRTPNGHDQSEVGSRVRALLEAHGD